MRSVGGGLDLSTLQTQLNNLATDVSNLSTDVSNLQTSLNDLTIEVDLRGVTQNWDKQLDTTNGDATAGREGCDSDRFTCLWGDTAVRDNETGLVWDRDPNTTTRSWPGAISHCADREVGGRKGWSLPMREQLATLVDISNSDPALPTGHPFLNVQSAVYWSASTRASFPSNAGAVSFDGGSVSFSNKVTSRLAWCVRGGQAYDGQDVLEALP